LRKKQIFKGRKGDDKGIGTVIVSLSLLYVSFAGEEDPAALTRPCNAYVAGVIAGYPGRFGEEQSTFKYLATTVTLLLTFTI
jgi:hypothetical protein